MTFKELRDQEEKERQKLFKQLEINTNSQTTPYVRSEEQKPLVNKFTPAKEKKPSLKQGLIDTGKLYTNIGGTALNAVKQAPGKIKNIVTNPKESLIGAATGFKNMAENINQTFEEKIALRAKDLVDKRNYDQLLAESRQLRSNREQGIVKPTGNGRMPITPPIQLEKSGLEKTTTYQKGIKGELDKNKQQAFESSQTLGKIGGAALITAATGNPLAGKIAFGASTQQEYQEQALAEGKNETQAIVYSIPMTIAETFLEGKLGVGFKFGKKQLIKAAAEEGLEEFAIPYVEEAVRAIEFGEKIDLKGTTEEAIKAAVDGATMGLLLQGAQNAVPTAVNIQNKLKNNQKVSKVEIETAIKDTQAVLGEDILKQTVEQAVNGVNNEINKGTTNETKQVDQIPTQEQTHLKTPLKEEIQPSKQVQQEIITQPKTRKLDLTKEQTLLPTESKGAEVSNFQKNVQNAPIVSNEFKDLVTELKYDPVSNKETMDLAKKRLDENLDNEVVRLFSMPSKEASATDVAELLQLQYQYQQDGNKESFRNTINKLREIGTEAGRSVQAFAMLRIMTPEGMVYYAQKDLQDVFDTIKENKSKQWLDKNQEKFNLTNEDMDFIKSNMQKVVESTSEREQKILLAQIQKLVNDKIPADVGKQIKGFRRISMLFNAKTQIRNIVGNTIIAPLNIASDIIGFGIEKGLSKKTGMKTIAPIQGKEYARGFKKGASEVIQDYKLGIDTNQTDIERFEIGKGKTFSEKTPVGKLLNKVDRLNSTMLKLGDNPFFEAEFNNSLKNQMKLNKVNEPTADMIDIATQTAMERTWQDNNNYTKAVIEIRNAMNKLNFKGFGLGDVIIPFAKTPANITKAMVDYSPVGLVKSLTLDARKFKNKFETNTLTPLDQRKFVNNIAKGISGSLLYMLAFGMKDLLSGGADDDKDIRDFMKNTMGVQPYSIKIGDKTYTYDWLQPVATPFAIIADMNKNKGKDPLGTILSGMGTAGDRLIEQSFMRGISDLFGNISKGDFEGIFSGLVEDLPASFIPTLSKQLTDVIDKNVRMSYGNTILETIKGSTTDKIPGQSTTLPKRYDILGQEVLKYGGDNNIFNSFISPARVSSEKNTEVGKEILNVYRATEDKTIFPRVAPSSVKDGQETVKLDNKQKSEFQKISGTTFSDEVNKLLKSNDYKNMSAIGKAEVLTDLVSYSQAVAKKEVLGIEMSDVYNGVNGFKEVGGNASDFYLTNNTLQTYADEEKTIRKTKTIDTILNTDYSDEQKSYLYGRTYSSPKALSAFDKTGIEFDLFLQLQKKTAGLEAIDDPKSNIEGKVISGSKKEQYIKELQSLPTTRTKKLVLLAFDYGLDKNQKTEVFNYINGLKLSANEKKGILEQMSSFTFYENGKLKGW